METPLISLLPLAGVWLAAVVAPGPNFLMVSRQAVACSRASGLGVALGVSLGAGVWAVAALAGLQALFTLCPLLFSLVRILGGAYLVYLGLKTLGCALRPASCEAASPARTNTDRASVHPLRLGLFTSFSNPKTAMFFASVFGALLPVHAPLWLLTAAVLMLVAISTLWYGGVAYLFSLPGPRRAYLALKRPLDALAGGLFTALGARLALQR